MPFPAFRRVMLPLVCGSDQVKERMGCGDASDAFRAYGYAKNKTTRAGGLSLSKKSLNQGLFWYNRGMLTEKKTIERDTLEIMCTEMLVPKKHLLRKIDEAGGFRTVI